MKTNRWLSSFDSLFNKYSEDSSTPTNSFNLNDPHMQISYIWARMMLKRDPYLTYQKRAPDQCLQGSVTPRVTPARDLSSSSTVDKTLGGVFGMLFSRTVVT